MIDNHPSKGNINLVIGLGKSGFWAAKYLRSINKRVIVWESKDGKEFLERKTELEELNTLVSLNTEFVFEEIKPRTIMVTAFCIWRSSCKKLR